MADASIVLKLIDQTSSGLSAVRRATQETGRSFGDLASKVAALREKNAALNSSYADLQTQIVDAKRTMQDAQRAYRDNADEINRTNLTRAQEAYKSLTDQLQDYRAASAETRKEIRELETEMHRLGDIGQTAGSSGGISGSAAGSGDQTDVGASPLTGWGAASSGLAKQLGGALTDMGSSMLSSLLGSSDAEVVSSMLGGAAAGAATGLLAGPVGAGIGAVIGGVSGLLSGAVSQVEARDDMFRDYRDELISASEEKLSTALSSGSNTEATREQDRIGFAALLGSADDAASLLDAVRDLSNVTPYVYDDLTGIARQLAIFDRTSGDIYGNLIAIGDAGAALSMSASDMQGLAALLGKIGDTDKYSSQFSRSLRNYGINPASIFAEYYGVSTEEANRMMSDGSSISGGEALDAILSVLASRFGGMMEAQSLTYAGALSTREGLEAETQARLGAGYNETRTSGLAAHNAWMQEDGLAEALEIIGRANAQRDNLQDAFYRDIMGGIFAGDEATVVDVKTQARIEDLREQYLQAVDEYAGADEQRQMEIGADISRIYTEAEALVTAAVDASAKLDAWDQAAIDTATGVGQIVGILGSYADRWAYSKVVEKGEIGSLSGIRAGIEMTSPVSGGHHRASGQRTIPYDGFPILAHQGEALLTAAEAREYRSGGGSGPAVTVTGNSFVVRQESDIDAIAEALYRRFRQVARIME